jgi:hypothetical protein
MAPAFGETLPRLIHTDGVEQCRNPKDPVFPGSGGIQRKVVYSPSSRNVRRSSGEFFWLSTRVSHRASSWASAEPKPSQARKGHA